MSRNYYPACPTTNYYVVEENDTADSIARRFNVTTEELLENNYGAGVPFFEGQILCIPEAPPPVEVEVDIAELRLRVLSSGGQVVNEFPISAFSIPKGNFVILRKMLDIDINYGARIMGLSSPDIYIRSRTVLPNFTGTKNIILDNEDAAQLFNTAPVGTPVRII